MCNLAEIWALLHITNTIVLEGFEPGKNHSRKFLPRKLNLDPERFADIANVCFSESNHAVSARDMSLALPAHPCMMLQLHG